MDPLLPYPRSHPGDPGEGLLGDLQGLVIHHNYMGLEELPEAYPRKWVWAPSWTRHHTAWGWPIPFSALPVQTKIITTFGHRGINYQTSGAFLHEGGRMTTWMASRTTYDVKDAVIFGSEGKIEFMIPGTSPPG